jgi:hypothetical protein
MIDKYQFEKRKLHLTFLITNYELRITNYELVLSPTSCF